jgi:hypothetical protein
MQSFQVVGWSESCQLEKSVNMIRIHRNISEQQLACVSFIHGRVQLSLLSMRGVAVSTPGGGGGGNRSINSTHHVQ